MKLTEEQRKQLGKFVRLAEKRDTNNIDWSHPMIGCNPWMMAMSWQMAAWQLLMDPRNYKAHTQTSNRG
jgi:hypothetical protein